MYIIFMYMYMYMDVPYKIESFQVASLEISKHHTCITISNDSNYELH